MLSRALRNMRLPTSELIRRLATIALITALIAAGIMFVISIIFAPTTLRPVGLSSRIESFTMSHSNAPADPTLPMICRGRYCFRQPPGYFIGHESLSIGRSQIRPVTWSPLDQNGFADSIKRQIAEVEARQTDRYSPADLIGKIEQRLEILPGEIEALAYRWDMNTHILTWAYLVKKGSGGIWLIADGLDQESSVVRSTIERQYSTYERLPSQTSLPVPGLDGFYTNNGYFKCTYDPPEEVSLRLLHEADESLDIQISFRSLNKDPEKSGLFARFQGLISGAAFAFAPDIRLMRNRTRSVANIRGDELLLELREREPYRVFFTFKSEGRAHSKDSPRVVIKMEGLIGDIAEKTAIWDALLSSFVHVSI